MRPPAHRRRGVLSGSSRRATLTTTLVRANRAMALGMTIRLLNISVSSHTRSLDIVVPRKMKMRATTV